MTDLFQNKKTGPPKKEFEEVMKREYERLTKEKNPKSGANTSEVLNASNNSSVKNNITDKNAKGKKKETKYTMESSLRKFSIKIYAEQLPNGEDDLWERIKEQSARDVQLLAIKHDKDYDSNDWFLPSIEKPHIHIIGRYMDNKPRKVRTILKMLNIVFREELDENLFKKNGMESIRTFEGYAMYLTHETEQAMFEGKALYDIEEIVSNLDLEGIKQVREGYVRITVNSHKVSMDEMAELCKTAQKLGEELKDFEEWYMNLPLPFQSNSKMKQCREYYAYGMKRAIEGMNNINRLSVFIQGEANTGKTFAVKQFFTDRNMPTISIDNGGTGALDTLTVRTQGIIIDDAKYGSMLRMSDNYAVQVKRRNSNNPYWCGSYFIIVSNDSFEDFIKKCGTDEDIKALKSRFYICRLHEDEYLNTKELIVEQVSKRGTSKDQKERLEKFKEFKKSVEDSLNNYDPKENFVDYSSLGFGNL